MIDQSVKYQPRLTSSEICYCLLHILRDPNLFAYAKQFLRPTDFSQTAEVHFGLIWSAAIDVAARNGGTLPTQGTMWAIAQCVLSKVDGSSGELNKRDEDTTIDLLGWSFDFAESGLNAEYYKSLVERLIVERTAWRDIRQMNKQLEQKLLLVDPAAAFDAAASKIRAVQNGASKPVRSLSDDWKNYEDRLAVYRGRELLGLQTGMQQLDARTLGLRGLMVLGAMPNVGKTALVLEMGLGVVRNDPDACFLLVSLEMCRQDLYTRIHCNVAQMDYKTLVFGDKALRGQADLFTGEQRERLAAAKAWVEQNGKRVRILDRETLGSQVSASGILAAVNAFKKECGASRAFIAIDYLQLLPVPTSQVRDNELETDRYRVRVAQDIVAGTRSEQNPIGDAVLVISESRKPGTGRGAWGEALADLMGSARLGYAADAVLLYRRMDDDEISQAYGGFNGKMTTSAQDLEAQGISPAYLSLAKGRDGMRIGEWPLEYHFNRSIFREIESAQVLANRGPQLAIGRRLPHVPPANGAGVIRQLNLLSEYN